MERETDDVDVLVNSSWLREVHDKWDLKIMKLLVCDFKQLHSTERSLFSQNFEVLLWKLRDCYFTVIQFEKSVQ